MPIRLLVVEDDPAIQYALVKSFGAEGYEVERAGTGRAALEKARIAHFDCVLLDLVLPDMSGLDICTSLRRSSAVPIIILTAKGSEVDRVVGLELGADDYVPKPFSMQELKSRVRALLRRRELDRESEPSSHEVGDLILDPERLRVTVHGRTVRLTPTEFRLLAMLAERPGRILSRQKIVNRLWGGGFIDDHTVDSHIRNLRKKLESDPADPRRILNVRGSGYQLVAH